MKNYIFRTTATMKEYNRCKWWIDPDIVTEKRISAETVADALEIWREQVEERHYIAVSKNAIKNKSKMFVDTDNGSKQVGYVITGKTEFENRDNYRWSEQYIDLWVTILTVTDTEF